MKRLAVSLLSAIFLLAGIMLGLKDYNPVIIKQNTIAATPMFKIPNLKDINLGSMDDLPEDIVRDLAKKKGVLDTAYITKTDTIREQVTKVKVKKVPVPSNIIEVNVSPTRTDTIQVPVYYLATQMGMKEGPTDKCIQLYEVHKVDEICPEINNSSVSVANE